MSLFLNSRPFVWLKPLMFSMCCVTLMSACMVDGDVNGVYSNADSSSERVKLTLSRTGDGIISGVYEENAMSTSEVGGHVGMLSHSIKINVRSGACAGTFEGTFVLKGGILTGHLMNSSNEKCEIILNLVQVHK